MSDENRKYLKRDKSRCSVIIRNNDVDGAKNMIPLMIDKYSTHIKGFHIGFKTYPVEFAEDESYIYDMNLMVHKFETLLDFGVNKSSIPRTSNENQFNITNTNSNDNKLESTMINEINIDIKIDRFRDEVSNHGMLTQESVEEILAKLDELQDISDSDETRPNKWKKTASLVEWTTTQGVDIATKMMPLIISMLNQV